MTSEQRPTGNTPLPAAPGDRTMATEWPAPFVPGGTPPGPEQYAALLTSRRVSWYIPIVGRILMFFAALTVFGALAWGVLNSFEFTAPGVQNGSVAVSGAPTLVVRNPAGRVRVVAGASDRVTVEARKEARGFSRSAARRELERLDVRPRVAGEAPSQEVIVDVGGDSEWFPFGGQQVDLYVTVPPTTNIRLDAATGNIEIEDVTGALTIEATAGNTTLEDVTITGKSAIRSSAGNVTVDGKLAADADLEIRGRAGNVNVTLPATTSTRLNASANAGSITVSPWNVPVERHAARAVAAGDLGGPTNSTLTVQTHAGNILVVTPDYGPRVPEIDPDEDDDDADDPPPPPTPPAPPRGP